MTVAEAPVRPRRRVTREQMAAGAAICVLLAALGFALSRNAPTLAYDNGKQVQIGAVVPAGGRLCQAGQYMPGDAGSVRVWASTASRPGGALALSVTAGGNVVTHGRAPGGYRDQAVSVPLTGSRSEHLDVTVCIRSASHVAFMGAPPGPNDPVRARGGVPLGPTEPAAVVTPATPQPGPVVIRLEWRRAHGGSWLSLAPTVAQRVGVTKASFVGGWTLWLLVALMVAAAAIAVRLALVGGRRVRAAACACAAVAVLNGVVWAVLTPAFQTPDESVQAAYVQYVGETGRLPRPLEANFQPSQEEALAFTGVPFSLTGRPSWSQARWNALQRRLAAPGLGRKQERGASYIASAPPLYFALEAIPYRLAHSGSYFDRLMAMRLFSTLFAGVTAVFVFLFLRELMPANPRLWAVGALAVALHPLFGFISGGVSYDGLLWTAASALLYLLARGFRRGLTPRLGAAIGLAVLVGLLAKGSMLGLVPGTAVALGLMSLRARSRAALLGVAAAVACAAIPFGLWLLADSAIWHRSVATTVTPLAGVHTSLGGELSYIWQFYLPRLPFMGHVWFKHYPTYPLWESYFQGFVGRFGWFEYGFASWVSWLGLAVVVALVALAARALQRSAGALRGRRAEIASYALIAAGLALLVNAAGYRFRVFHGASFEQTRYLFPLIGFYGALVALAVRGASRRWAPALGAVLIVVALGHDLFAQLLTIAHYYA